MIGVLPVYATGPAGLRCPDCAAPGTAIVAVDDGAIAPGDLVICQNCGLIGVVTAALEIRRVAVPDFDRYPLLNLAQIVDTAKVLRVAYERRN
jgi:hypothetical protein